MNQSSNYSQASLTVESVKSKFGAYRDGASTNKALIANEGYNEEMEAIGRPELDAKLEAIEARADARLSRFEERINQAIGEMQRGREELSTNIQLLSSNAEKRELNMQNDLSSFRENVKTDNRDLRRVIVVTAIGSVVTIVLGIAAFNATVLSNMVASFESGKNTSANIVQATEQLKQTQEQLKAIQERLAEKASKK